MDTESSETVEKLRQALEGVEFPRLAEAGYRLVAEGAVAFEEIDKAVGR